MIISKLFKPTLNQLVTSSKAAIDLASIMVGVIVIGLIGGVIAATVFAVIPWAQDNAAKQQLDAVSTAQSARAGLNDGKYSANLGDLFDSNSAKVLVLSNNTTCWGAFKQSATGKYFYSSNTNTAAVQVPTPWPSVAPKNYPAGCTWPKSSAAFASDDYKLNTLLAEASIHETNITSYKNVALSIKQGESFTFAASWRMTSPNQTTIIGQETFFKMQQLSDNTNMQTYSGWNSTTGWKDATWSSNATEANKTNYAISSVDSTTGTILTKNRTETIPAPNTAMSSLNIGGNTSTQEAITGSGVIYDALVWYRTLTSEEQTTLAKYLATRQ